MSGILTEEEENMLNEAERAWLSVGPDEDPYKDPFGGVDPTESVWNRMDPGDDFDPYGMENARSDDVWDDERCVWFCGEEDS
jgi:hypothetical protein